MHRESHLESARMFLPANRSQPVARRGAYRYHGSAALLAALALLLALGHWWPPSVFVVLPAAPERPAMASMRSGPVSRRSPAAFAASPSARACPSRAAEVRPSARRRTSSKSPAPWIAQGVPGRLGPYRPAPGPPHPERPHPPAPGARCRSVGLRSHGLRLCLRTASFLPFARPGRVACEQ